MQFSITILSVFALAIFTSAAPTLTISQRQDEQMQYVADLANQLNEDIVHTTQFFEAFPTLSGSALTTQANAAETALLDTTGVIDTIAMELSNNAMTQVIKAGLVDNDFLLDISLQLQDFAQGINLDILARNFSSILTNK
jgi:ribosomal protein L16 Arg81 hydroxylase